MKLLLSFLFMTASSLSFAVEIKPAGPMKIVENQMVCMVTDMLFPKMQIPVTVGKKTYYGCCENCKATLANDPKARTATDPVSGKPVDKATAVIAAKEDGSVVYFESKKNFETFAKAQK